jgi:prepilin-type N-terminal cleavage/methylation domain-containing protein
MKRIAKKSGTKKAAFSAVVATKAGFTIVELLTVMSIIVILIGLLVPALNSARRYARKVKQKAQLHSVEAALELFNSELDGYPPSDSKDGAQVEPYCGAMKLCEALMGQDLMGFHPESSFIFNGTDISGRLLYNSNTLTARRGPYLPLESANAFRLEELYGASGTGDFSGNAPYYVLCDEYTRDLKTGVKAGMPILYYKANTEFKRHYDPALADFYDPTKPDDPKNNIIPLETDNRLNIYNYWDNHRLVGLGKPLVQGSTHKLIDPKRFYMNTKSDKIVTPTRPVKADTYILISAGFDSEYGTADDICNFDLKYRELPP